MGYIYKAHVLVDANNRRADLELELANPNQMLGDLGQALLALVHCVLGKVTKMLRDELKRCRIGPAS